MSTHWIKTKKLRDGAHLPTTGSDGAAGADLYACLSNDMTIIYPGETLKIPTGIAVEIPDGYFGAVFARSGLATKFGLRPANCVGVIDSDYRGEVMVALHNDSNAAVNIINGERIAQLVIIQHEHIIYTEADELSDTGRGEGGFGSTGVK